MRYPAVVLSLLALARIRVLMAVSPRGSSRHRYIIDGSALDTEDQGVLSPIDPPTYWFNNRLEVVGGTGIFSDAGGMIRSHGMVGSGGWCIQLAYHGRICR